jgi:hypothetical protein
MPSSSEVSRLVAPVEPEHAIEKSNVELCVISGKGELRCRDPPLVIRQGRRNYVVFVSYVAVRKEVGPRCVKVAWKADVVAGGPTTCP